MGCYDRVTYTTRKKVEQSWFLGKTFPPNVPRQKEEFNKALLIKGNQ